ncbi:uncharacterized protein TRAVEDRAFT_74546 [Trametes versicolor FP-101664 SS1]|uniref:uncharacterized protein n=2 Tax=Trametes versicolor (strain FP-101664) TaxID=717944 RepID=UPI0004621E02|nr:uncharacterized protein TRAVEDRAFT_74546 [Trametes versicolor FP-101664 SS1]EIW54518.1 hypothetical protein TRAVEDRAFT_74546 [Trametes versicolor FP-101664 SS1]
MSSNANKSKEEQSSSRELKDAQDALDGAVQPSEPGRAGRLEGEFVDKVNAAGQASSSSDGLGVLMDGVNGLVESLPPLVRALDAVAQIHPFLALAVGAFKVVVELEAKRRDNDKKINLLFLEMRNMMAALLQLQGVRTNHVGRDGLSIGARLDDLIKKTAKDIKECANACDTYSRKRLLVKVLKAPSWDGTLKEYIQLFSDRKGEFNFAISIHTGLGVDRANDKLDTLITKVDVVIAFFEKTAPREQRALAEAIRQEGGAQTVLGKSDVLQELLLKEQQFEAAGLPSTEAAPPGYRVESGLYARRRSGAGPGAYYYSRAAENQRVRRRVETTRRGGGGYRYRPSYSPPRRGRERPYAYTGREEWPEEGREGAEEEREGSVELRRLMQDLADEPAVAIRKNLVWFARKFAIQQREIVLEMTAVVVHEGDRVISSVLAGPHERIIDPDLYEIWKDMRWRGIVKARHRVGHVWCGLVGGGVRRPGEYRRTLALGKEMVGGQLVRGMGQGLARRCTHAHTTTAHRIHAYYATRPPRTHSYNTQKDGRPARRPRNAHNTAASFKLSALPPSTPPLPCRHLAP